MGALGGEVDGRFDDALHLTEAFFDAGGAGGASHLADAKRGGAVGHGVPSFCARVALYGDVVGCIDKQVWLAWAFFRLLCVYEKKTTLLIAIIIICGHCIIFYVFVQS